METENTDPVMTVREAARYLGISERAVRHRATRRRVAASLTDGQWLIYPLRPPPLPFGRSADTPVPMGDKRAREDAPLSDGREGCSADAQAMVGDLVTPDGVPPVMGEWIVQLAARLEASARENGRLGAELAALRAAHTVRETPTAADPSSRRGGIRAR